MQDKVENCHLSILEFNVNIFTKFQSNVSKLEEDVSSLRQEKKELESELRKCSVSEQEKFCSLQQVKEEIGLLTTATEELMEELEMSQSLQKDQKVEIESLKKICTIKGDVTEEVVRLRDALTGISFIYILAECQKFCYCLAKQIMFPLHNL